MGRKDKMMTMIERVARALCENDCYDPDELLAVPPSTEIVEGWTLYVSDARAAIEAIREPTISMGRAGAPDIETEVHADIHAEVTTALNVWRAMIDEALKESEE